MSGQRPYGREGGGASPPLPALRAPGVLLWVLRLAARVGPDKDARAMFGRCAARVRAVFFRWPARPAPQRPRVALGDAYRQ